MATLATYFGLGQQTHRSLDDVRMNLEVLKYCATVLFLESSLPDILVSESLVSPTSTARRTRTGGRVLPMEMSYTPNTDPRTQTNSNQTLGEQILHYVEPVQPETESFNMRRLSEEIMDDAIQEENAEPQQSSRPVTISEGCSSSSTFLTPDDVITTSINAFLVPFYRGSQRIQILHGTALLKLHCTNLKVRFGISTKFVDQAGRPRLSFVVDAPPSICQVLDVCDNHAHRVFMESGSTSDWRPVVVRKNGYWNFPTVRLQIPTIVTGDVARYGTEIFQREASSGEEQKLVFSRFDAAELENIFTAGSIIDVFFSMDSYDYQQSAGIRLVTEKLVIHSK